MQQGGYPCGFLPRWRSPPRYADNRTNRKRFGGVPPLCSPKSQDFVTLVQSGERLGEGKQSIVYKYQNTAVKVFDRKNLKAFRDNVAFLKQNQGTGVVPKYIASNEAHAWIQMEHLRDCVPLRLKEFPADQREALLIAIAKARAKLPKDTSYSDLTNLGNIAYKLLANGEYRVKFYEGGVAHREPNKLQAQLYVTEMARALRITRSNFAKLVAQGQIAFLTPQT